MEQGRPRVATKTALDVLVGIEVGILGGVIMMLWFTLLSPLLGESPWLIFNRFASALYPGFRNTLGLQTVVGAGANLVATGLAGGVHGAITPGGRLFGLGIAASFYLLNYLLLWKKIAPALLHTPQPILIAGYFLFGSALGQHSNLLARARRS